MTRYTGGLSARKDYIWNTAAGIINAAEVILMSMIVTRYGDLSDAGILSLAFAVGNVLMSIGAFGGRMFIATDVNRRYSFRMYMLHRLCSACFMVLSLAIYIAFSGIGVQKAEAVTIITLIYLIEVIENCIWGYLQSRDKLYIGAQMFCTRWIAIIATFTVCMIASENMIDALLGGAIAGILVFTVWVFFIRKILADETGCDVGKHSGVREDSWFISLTANTFPLFMAGFCSLFINNIPKFAIDKYMNDDIQACYGFVAMPVFIIGLLNQFIYQPKVAGLAREFNYGLKSKFRDDVKKQIIEVIVIMGVCVIGAAIIGVPVLSLVYNTNLKGYWAELVILQFAGGFLALSGYLNVILTIMRRQKIILYGYVTSLLFGIMIMFVAVKHAGTIGASAGYLSVMIVLFVYYYISYCVYFE